MYPRVIYILRDGRDVYTSYYHYNQLNRSEDTTFEEFLKGDHWPTRWAKHVEKWLEAANARDNVLVVRFEDLKEDSARELQRMVSFLGKDTISKSRIQCAVEASSFENMRRLEKERGRRYGNVERFMRKGKAGNWQKLFTNEARKVFNRKEGRMLFRLGYAEDYDWQIS
jgi:hypothetical protein